MGGFSIWHWLIVLLVAGTIIWLWLRARKNRKPRELEGFGGWLVLMAVGIILAPLGALVNFVSFIVEAPSNLKTLFPAMFYGVAALNAGLAVVLLLLAVLMLRRSRKFPSIFLYSGVFFIFFPLVETFIGIILISIQSGQAFSELFAVAITKDVIRQYCVSTLVLGAWMLYVKRSKRVANTFIMP